MFGVGAKSVEKGQGYRAAAVSAAPVSIELAEAGLLVPANARVLLSVFVRGIELAGEADIVLRLHRERFPIGSFRYGALCGATGAAHWVLEQSAFSTIDVMPPGGPCVYRLSAEIVRGSANFQDAQLWPSLLS